MEDEKIIDLYWARDTQALERTQEKYGAYCGRIAANILESREDCEECVNDTWLRAWNSMPKARPDILSAFLGAITRNLCLDRYRKFRAAKRGGGEIDAVFDELCCGTAKAEPLEHVTGKELAACIDGFLAAQTKRNRVIFVRRYWYCDSVADIAARCGTGEGNVRSVLFRMREKLREHLKKEGYEP